MKKRTIKLGLVAILCMIFAFALTSCGDEPYDYDLSEYVKVGEYKGLTYDKIKVSVSKSEVKNEIENRCEQNATTETVTSGKVKDGDTINVAYEGRIDGETFEGGSSDSYDITIGQTSMIDGFTDGLIGKKVGEEVTLNLKFPDEYQNADVAGKDVVFVVNIKSKQKKVIPEYNLDFVKKNSDCKSLEEYEESVKKDLIEQKEKTAESNVKDELWNKIVDSSEVIKYPPERDEFINTTMESFKKDAENNDMEWKEYLDKLDYTEKALKKRIKSVANDKVFTEMIVYTIAREENLEVSDKEYDETVENMLASSGMDKDSFKENYGMTIEEYCDQQGLRTSLLLGKVMDKVFEYAKAE